VVSGVGSSDYSRVEGVVNEEGSFQPPPSP
jgi:hypothetical protein